MEKQTWRAYLVTDIDPFTGLRQITPGFTESTYFKMYQEILNNDSLLQKVEEYGFQVRFVIHPNMSVAQKLYQISDKIEIVSSNEEYKKIFAESSLIVTDYSSVAFDFAYLRKPVIYYQADKEEFFSGNHTYDKGYFEYERDGFGEVVYSSDDLVKTMIEYMSNGCKLKDYYRERINRTFPFSDQNNCQRVCDEIMKL